ncbi:MAG: tetratricopeptide repeat protein [Hyphomonas sp.]|uniref:tetratricopeptide repeat protein n=1 Tax=Hyphomonas sp. TaxID=87 RepID=UPI0035280918
MFRHILLAAAGALLVPAAMAQVSVFGGGLARDCYEAAFYQTVSAQEGEKICSQALSAETMKFENRAATFTNRGVLRMRLGKYEASLGDYDTAKRMKPDLGAIWLNEGAAYIFRKDYGSALASLDKAVELNSQDLYAAYYNRAIAKENLGDVAGAYYDFQKALELKPDFERAEWQLARFNVSTN